MITLTDIYDLCDTYDLTLDEISTGTEKGYLSHYYDLNTYPEASDSLYIYYGNGIRKGEMFYYQPCHNSVQYKTRVYFVLLDSNNQEVPIAEIETMLQTT